MNEQDQSSNNIPDSVSFSDLEAALRNAKPTEVEKPDSERDFDRLGSLACEAKNELFKAAGNNPLAMKLLLLQVMDDMYRWHRRMSEEMRESGQSKSADSWLLDAGAFQAMLNTLVDIEITDDDPTPRWKE